MALRNDYGYFIMVFGVIAHVRDTVSKIPKTIPKKIDGTQLYDG